MGYTEADRFKNFLGKQSYRKIFNWQWIEKEAGLPTGRIGLVVDGKESFSEQENAKLYTFFYKMTSDCLPIPHWID
jgi:hypothetical protein